MWRPCLSRALRRCGTARASRPRAWGLDGERVAEAAAVTGSRGLHSAPALLREGRPRDHHACSGAASPSQARRFAAAASVAEAPALDFIRNVAIIAHVDHGKTTLVDQLMKQSGMGLKVTERMLDSKDLEQERGITILSKATRISWNGYLFNIVDTPGHADFGGEVERVLSMVDGVVLLVDAVEGPKTQTKFVLQKALQHPAMKPLVVINKVDRPQAREPGEVENEIFDIFVRLASSEDQLDYPTLYASGKAGFCCRSLEEAKSADRPDHMLALYETIRDHVPPPRPVEADPAIVALDEKNRGFSMLVTQMDRLPALGPTVTGKVHSGQIKKGDKITAKSLEGEVVTSGKVKDITVVQGVSREPVKMAVAGDIVSVSVAGFVPRWTQTLVSHPKVPSIDCTAIDPPVISVRASVNDSPLAGKDGKYLTLHSIGERLDKEAMTNPAIAIQESPRRDYFEIRAAPQPGAMKGALAALLGSALLSAEAARWRSPAQTHGCHEHMSQAECASAIARAIVGHSRDCFSRNSHDEASYRACTADFCQQQCGSGVKGCQDVCLSHANPLFGQFVKTAHAHDAQLREQAQQAAGEEAAAMAELEQAQDRMRRLNAKIAVRAEKAIKSGNTKVGRAELAKVKQLSKLQQQIDEHLANVAQFRGMARSTANES